MSKLAKIEIEVTAEQAEFLARKVASGAAASEGEVVREALGMFQDHDAAIERWLREEVLPTLEDHERDPSRARPAEEVFDRIEADLLARIKAAE